MADIFFENGDIGISLNGDIAVIQSYDEITQSAINNISLKYGSYEFNTKLGNIAQTRRLKISNSSLDIIETDCINAILYDKRVARVISMDASYDEEIPNTVDISFVIETIDGTRTSSSIKITV